MGGYREEGAWKTWNEESCPLRNKDLPFVCLTFGSLSVECQPTGLLTRLSRVVELKVTRWLAGWVSV